LLLDLGRKVGQEPTLDHFLPGGSFQVEAILSHEIRG
jgi:hypothetical protein